MAANPLIKRAVFCLLILASILGDALPTSADATTAQQNCQKINNFDVCGRFLDEWSMQGTNQANVYVNGLPITARHPEVSLTDGKVYDTQWFERAKFEAHPENKPPYDVLLGLLGTSLIEGRGAIDPATGNLRDPGDTPFLGITRPAGADGQTKLWFPETQHSVSGKILQYWQKYGGLQQFGFPLSEQFDEISATDGKTYTVQYFERNRFELHPEKPAPYEVELGLLGVQQYHMTPVAAADLPIAPPPDKASNRDTAVIASETEPASLYDLAETSPVALSILDALDNGLVGEDYKGAYFPEVAWYVPTIENGGSYFVGTGDDRHLVTKYKLRRGVKWSDGPEVTSNDAVFSYQLIMNPDTQVASRTMQLKVAWLDNPDKYTVIYNWLSYRQANDLLNKHADDPQYAFLKSFADQHQPVTDPDYVRVGTIHPQHALKGIQPAKLYESAYAHEGHIGTGPYKVEKWVPTQEIDLVRNDNYTLTAPPLLKRIVIRLVPDPMQLFVQLKTGELDGTVPGIFPFPTLDLDQIGSNQVVDYAPGLRWNYIDFNLHYPPFQDRAVREAIVTAINRQKIVDTALPGKAAVLNTAAPPGSWVSLQNPDVAAALGDKYKLPTYNYDPNRANQLLDQAGWLPGPDGIRTRGDQRLSFKLAIMASSTGMLQVEPPMLQADLAAVGIDAQVGPFGRPCGGRVCDSYDYTKVCTMCQFGATTQASLDFSRWDSSRMPTEQNRDLANYQAYNNPAADALIRQYSSELDVSKRQVLAAQLQVLLMQDIPTIPLFANPNIEVHSATLLNWHTSSGEVTPFYNVAQWYFK